MLPVPTLSSSVCFVTALVLAGIGIVTVSPVCVAVGAAGLLGLALALAMTVPLGRRARRQRLEFAWWLSHGDPGRKGGAVVPGVPFEIRCYIRNRASYGLDLSSLEPVVGHDAKVQDGNGKASQLNPEPNVLWVAPQARTEFAFRLTAAATGRVVLHGLAVALRGPAGLFRVPLYFPNPLAVKVLPAAAARLRLKGRVAPRAHLDRSGRSRLRQRGGGTEFYELRELNPGDPYKSIAWKASARFGKLLVREVEQEVQTTHWFLLDAGGTMRGGKLGSRKLDLAIDFIASESRRVLDDGGRVGLITVDSRVISHVPPEDGRGQMLRVFESLLGVTELVDADLTSVTETEVVERVGNYLRHQDGIEFRKPPAGTWNVAQMVTHVRSIMLSEAEDKRVSAENSADRILRSFCRVRGIRLPYKAKTTAGQKTTALAEGILLALKSRKNPSSLTVVTDFDDDGELRPLERAVSLVRRHQHSVRFVVPDGASLLEPASDDLDKTLRAIFVMGEARRFASISRRLGKLGARIEPLAPLRMPQNPDPNRQAA